MAEIVEKAIKEVISEFITSIKKEGPEVTKPFILRLIEARLAPIMNKYEAIASTGKRNIEANGGSLEEMLEAFKKEYNEATDLAIEAIEKTEDFRGLRYQKCYEALKKSHEQKDINSWGDLLTEIYQDDDALNEIFVRLVEEQENIKITSAKQLQEVTGITELWSYWKGEEQIEYPDTKEGKKQAQKQAKEEIEETFILAMEFRYSNLLEGMLKTGAKYKDLLSIEPGSFHLSKEKQEYIIKKTLYLYYNLIEPSFFRPDLKTIAEEIEAPYSVLMDCLITEKVKTSEKIEKYVKEKLKKNKEDIEHTLKQKVEEYIDRQPATWKKEHHMTTSKNWSQERADLQRSQYVDAYVTWFNTVVWDELKLLSNPGDHERRVVEIHKPTILKEFKELYEEAIKFYTPVANLERE